MKVKNCLLLALAAGAATPALANPVDPADRIVSTREEATIPLYLDANGIVQQGSPFVGRDIRPIVYSAFPADTRAGSITIIASAFRGFAHVGEDIQFDPGIGAAGVGQLITYTVPVSREATPAAPSNADLVIRFWDTGTLTANPMLTGTAFEVDSFEDIGLQIPATGGSFLLTITPTTPLSLPNADTSIFVEYEWRAAVAGTGNGGTGALLAAPTISTSSTVITRNHPFRFWGWGNVLDTTGSSSGAGPRHAAIMGSTIRGFGRDADADGILEGQPVIAKGTTPLATLSEYVGPHAGLPTAVDLFGGTNAEARAEFEMRGVTASPLPPTADQDLGQLADGITNSSVLSLVPGGGQEGTVWLRFTLGADVTDARDAFLDITTENAATTIPDPVMALFSNDGQFVVFPGSDAGIDDDDAAGLLSQLSFGMGNRAATSGGPTGGETFNGEDGELLAADGPFWLGIAATPVSNGIGQIDEGFQLFTNATQGGNVQVTFNTNYIAAPNNLNFPSAVPTLTREYLPAGGNPGDPIAAPGAAGAETDPGDPDVLWYKFTTCKPFENNDSDLGDFVDMDFFISNALSILDDIAFIFDANGNLFAVSDDGDADGLPIPDAYTKPQFSFGNRGPRPSPGASVGAAAFAGQNGGLPPGTWYVAHCYFGAAPGPQTRADAQANGRWFVRPVTPNDSLGLQMDIFTGALAGDCSVCDSIDFNGDGIFPDNQDIVSLFTVFSGGACGDDVGVPSDTCHDIDFNNDGVFPDNQDLVEYLNAFAGGACPL
jgi:hypothetical protein